MSAKPLDPQTVQKIAKLARISQNPSPEFLEKYGQQLGAVLEYVEQLQQVDTDGINPLDGIRTTTIEHLRVDEPSLDQETYNRIRQHIIDNFPNRQGNLLVIPGIFHES